jgi:hypothetical protein
MNLKFGLHLKFDPLSEIERYPSHNQPTSDERAFFLEYELPLLVRRMTRLGLDQRILTACLQSQNNQSGDYI